MVIKIDMNSFFDKNHPPLIPPRGGTCHQFLPIWLKTFLAFPWVRSCVIILGLTSLFYGCIFQDGKWDDNIKLSARNVEFSADGDSVTIKTKGTWWWITGISVNRVNYYDFGIHPDSVSYKIERDCFAVERRDSRTLFIRVDANPRDSVRVITVGLEAGDYFDRVTVTQKAK